MAASTAGVDVGAGEMAFGVGDVVGAGRLSDDSPAHLGDPATVTASRLLFPTWGRKPG